MGGGATTEDRGALGILDGVSLRPGTQSLAGLILEARGAARRDSELCCTVCEPGETGGLVQPMASIWALCG